ncbi:MAG: hypothetical protein U0796_10425 [Gemmatales bacterium]
MRKKIIVGVIILVVLVVLLAWWWRRQPLPLLGNVASIKYHTYTTDGKVDVEIPEHLWPELWKCLLPVRRDYSPYKWVVLGDLEIVLKNSSSIRVMIYVVPDCGAFSIGGQYYLGGNSRLLRKLLDKLVSDSNNIKP